jgi:hypothetical protein
VLPTGVPWRVVPREIGCSDRTAARLLRDWRATGAWERLQRELVRRLDPADRIDWSHGMIDAGNIRPLKRAAGPLARRLSVGASGAFYLTSAAAMRYTPDRGGAGAAPPVSCRAAQGFPAFLPWSIPEPGPLRDGRARASDRRAPEPSSGGERRRSASSNESQTLPATPGDLD